MTTKKATLITLSVTCIVIAFSTSSCAPRRRWYSTYKDKNGEMQTEHYNEYKKRWYKKNWNNRRMWQ